jgi:hypothetical protein
MLPLGAVLMPLLGSLIGYGADSLQEYRAKDKQNQANDLLTKDQEAWARNNPTTYAPAQQPQLNPNQIFGGRLDSGLMDVPFKPPVATPGAAYPGPANETMYRIGNIPGRENTFTQQQSVVGAGQRNLADIKGRADLQTQKQQFELQQAKIREGRVAEVFGKYRDPVTGKVDVNNPNLVAELSTIDATNPVIPGYNTNQGQMTRQQQEQDWRMNNVPATEKMKDATARDFNAATRDAAAIAAGQKATEFRQTQSEKQFDSQFKLNQKASIIKDIKSFNADPSNIAGTGIKGSIWFTDARAAQAKWKSLKAKLEQESAASMKGQGSFSDYERQIVANAISSIDTMTTATARQAAMDDLLLKLEEQHRYGTEKHKHMFPDSVAPDTSKPKSNSGITITPRKGN